MHARSEAYQGEGDNLIAAVRKLQQQQFLGGVNAPLDGKQPAQQAINLHALHVG